jgi:uncharacterized protein (UPF0332 family)
VTPEAARFLDKARLSLADATLYQPIVPRIAGREAYLAAYHAAEALIFERTGKIAKTHRGLRAQFALLARDVSIDQAIWEILGQAYELKSLADYGTGTEAEISPQCDRCCRDSVSLRGPDCGIAPVNIDSSFDGERHHRRPSVEDRLCPGLRDAGGTAERWPLRLPLWPGP